MLKTEQNTYMLESTKIDWLEMTIFLDIFPIEKENLEVT